MSVLNYKLQYLKTDMGGEGVLVNTQSDMPAYRNLIGKEEYSLLQSGSKSSFITGVFNITGVTCVASQAYRLYVEKGDAYTWDTMVPSILSYLQSSLGFTSLNELPGSGQSVTSADVRSTADTRQWQQASHTLSN